MKIQYDIFKNPYCLKTKQLGIDNRGQGVELGTTEHENPTIGRSETLTCDCGLRVQHMDHSVTRWLH